jgi:hypothetical protein
VRGEASTGSAHFSQGTRASRWPTTRVSEEVIRNGSTPMSISRLTADGASLVCRVDSTRCPVIDAYMAMEATSSRSAS